MKLQEAQWALLQMDEAVYQSCLQQSIRVINQYFEQNNSKTQFLIQQLQTLQQKQITFAKPDLDESISLLNQWIESKESQMPETTGEHAS